MKEFIAKKKAQRDPHPRGSTTWAY